MEIEIGDGIKEHYKILRIPRLIDATIVSALDNYVHIRVRTKLNQSQSPLIVFITK